MCPVLRLLIPQNLLHTCNRRDLAIHTLVGSCIDSSSMVNITSVVDGKLSLASTRHLTSPARTSLTDYPGIKLVTLHAETLIPSIKPRRWHRFLWKRPYIVFRYFHVFLYAISDYRWWVVLQGHRIGKMQIFG